MAAYDEAARLFARADAAAESAALAPMLQKMVVDPNAAAQEHALDAVLSYCTHVDAAKHAVADIVPGLVAKGLGAPKAATRAKAVDICLMLVEIGCGEATVTELQTGLQSKQPKVVAATIACLCRILHDFGPKPVPLKSIVKALPPLFDHGDASVRDEAKALAVEMARWIGTQALRPHLSTLKPVQTKELDALFDGLSTEPSCPSRLTRADASSAATGEPSCAATAADTGAASGRASGAESSSVGASTTTVSAYDLAEAVEVLPKIPATFADDVAAAKWQTRKEALEVLRRTLDTVRIAAAADYGDLARVLKHALGDANVLVVVLAAECIGFLARGLRKDFAPYAGIVVAPLLAKFKERKSTVVAALRAALDQCHSAIGLAPLLDDLHAAAADKNPSVKSETLLFIVRCLAASRAPGALPKAAVKGLVTVCIAGADDGTPAVRDAAMEALGLLMSVVGERALAPLLEPLDKLKQAKIREHCERAGSASTATAASESKPPPPARPAIVGRPPGSANSTAPTRAPPVPAAAAKAPNAAAGAAKRPTMPVAVDSAAPVALTQEQLEAAADRLIPAAVRTQLTSAQWKERIAGCEALLEQARSLPEAELTEPEVIVRTLQQSLKDWKEVNFQVLSVAFSVLATLARRSPAFDRGVCTFALAGLCDKLSDAKLKAAAGDALMAFAEATSLDYVASFMCDHATGHKNPKVTEAALVWLAQAVVDFGPRLSLKRVVDMAKQSLQHPNPLVRTAAIALLGTLRVFVGPTVRTLLEDEKPALLATIDAEMNRRAGETAPAPTRQFRSDRAPDAAQPPPPPPSRSTAAETAPTGGAAAASLLDELLPRTNISSHISDRLLDMLSDANWKTRLVALEDVDAALRGAKMRIGPSLGELPAALAARLADSNRAVLLQALGVLANLATAVGPAFAPHLRHLLRPLLGVLSDSKSAVRAAAVSALDACASACTLASILTCGDAVAGVLGADQPQQRAELLAWLQRRLADSSTPHEMPELEPLLPALFACLEDRRPEVRKNANDLLGAVLQHLGRDVVQRRIAALKPTSQAVVAAALERHRPAKATAGATTTESRALSTAPVRHGSADAGAAQRPASPAPAARTACAAAPEAPLLMSSDKEMRAERGRRGPRWTFEPGGVPLPAMVEAARSELAACVGRTVLEDLASGDARRQIAGIDALLIPLRAGEYAAEAIGALDVLIKYITLRLAESNTTVLLRARDLLTVLLDVCEACSYRMSEYEASLLLPSLVLRCGDMRETVRHDMRQLLHRTTHLYPASKLSGYLMEGLRAKNARQRTELLGELAQLIRLHGPDVCAPSPAKALPIIAAYIGDRDNGVRSAALDACVGRRGRERRAIARAVCRRRG